MGLVRETRPSCSLGRQERRARGHANLPLPHPERVGRTCGAGRRPRPALSPEHR